MVYKMLTFWTLLIHVSLASTEIPRAPDEPSGLLGEDEATWSPYALDPEAEAEQEDTLDPTKAFLEDHLSEEMLKAVGLPEEVFEDLLVHGAPQNSDLLINLLGQDAATWGLDPDGPDGPPSDLMPLETTLPDFTTGEHPDGIVPAEELHQRVVEQNGWIPSEHREDPEPDMWMHPDIFAAIPPEHPVEPEPTLWMDPFGPVLDPGLGPWFVEITVDLTPEEATKVLEELLDSASAIMDRLDRASGPPRGSDNGGWDKPKHGGWDKPKHDHMPHFAAQEDVKPLMDKMQRHHDHMPAYAAQEDVKPLMDKKKHHDAICKKIYQWGRDVCHDNYKEYCKGLPECPDGVKCLEKHWKDLDGDCQTAFEKWKYMRCHHTQCDAEQTVVGAANATKPALPEGHGVWFWLSLCGGIYLLIMVPLVCVYVRRVLRARRAATEAGPSYDNLVDENPTHKDEAAIDAQLLATDPSSQYTPPELDTPLVT